jgi:peroxiredoxin
LTPVFHYSVPVPGSGCRYRRIGKIKRLAHEIPDGTLIHEWRKVKVKVHVQEVLEILQEKL